MKRATLTCAALVIVGCATQNTARRASVVDFLFPNQAKPAEVEGPSVMALPLRIGIVFVPETASKDAGYRELQWAQPALSAFTENDKIALMQRIGHSFQKYPLVKSVEFIPSEYLTPGGGFDNLDQIRTMFGTDVMVLLSYDQTQFTDEGMLTMTYWTIVGAYVVQGEKSETHTMLDAAIYSIPNRKLLFRAPGISRVRAAASPINLAEELRHNSQRSFEVAADNLVTNLETQLAVFKDRVKEEPEEFRVTAKRGYDLKAAGAIDPVLLLVILGVVGGLYLCAQTRTSR